MTRSEDKRQHPRVSQRLPVQSQIHGGVALETINLSAGGLSCTSPAYVAPMTRMSLALQIPSASNGTTIVEGEGIVVRTEPPEPSAANQGGYRIALFFSRMDDEHRRALQTWLNSRSQ
jgi:PilZ domain